MGKSGTSTAHSKDLDYDNFRQTLVALANTDKGIFPICYEVGVVTEVDVATLTFKFLATHEISNGTMTV